jgi:hypothetical protein
MNLQAVDRALSCFASCCFAKTEFSAPDGIMNGSLAAFESNPYIRQRPAAHGRENDLSPAAVLLELERFGANDWEETKF